MIIVNRLTNYTEAQKQAFIKKYSSSEYEVIMVENELQAWKYDEFDKAEILKPIPDPPSPQEQLKQAKKNKYNETLDGAREFIDNEAFYQFDENNSIEATDGNIGKMTAYALGFQTGTIEHVYWTSKEDNVLELDAEDVLTILQGLGTIQGNVWNIQFVAYKNAIEEAATVEEVNAIEVHYVN